MINFFDNTGFMKLIYDSGNKTSPENIIMEKGPDFAKNQVSFYNSNGGE